MDPVEEARANLREVAGRRRFAEQLHEEAINDLYDAIVAAKEAGVRHKDIVADSGVSKQWISRMSRFKNRGGT